MEDRGVIRIRHLGARVGGDDLVRGLRGNLTDSVKATGDRTGSAGIAAESEKMKPGSCKAGIERAVVHGL